VSGLASAKRDPSPPLSGVGSPIFVIGADACPGLVPPPSAAQPNAKLGWTITGTLTPVPPVDPNILPQPFQSDRYMTLSGSFANGSGELYNVSGTIHDTTLYRGNPGGQELKFNGFGDVKFTGDHGDHLFGQANVRFVTSPPELDFYFAPAPPASGVIDDGGGTVGISNCSIKAGV
jgi:hypothetical protein